MSERLTEVRLLNVPLENNYKHTFYFESASDQAQYFASKKVFSANGLSYQRKERYINFPKHIDALGGCNYVMHKNNNSKWYYSFIERMEYVNDGTTRIYIATDAMQTWLFDYTVKPSFVERQHVQNDTIGAHTVPESLETGEYIVNGAKNVFDGLKKENVNNIIIATTVNLNDPDFSFMETNPRIEDAKEFNATYGGNFGGVYSGVKYFKCTFELANKVLQTLANVGQVESVVSIFMCPDYLETRPLKEEEYNFWNGHIERDWVPELLEGDAIERATWTNENGEEPNKKPKSIDGYTPRNNKLLTYPYCYLLMSNNSGGACVYNYEDFDGVNCEFKVYTAVTPGMSIRLVPTNYKGVTNNNEEGLNLGKLPICSWQNDIYTNWLTQNGVNVAVSVASGLATTAFGVASVATGAGAVVGGTMIAGGLAQVAGSVGEVYTHSKQPPQAEGNINNGDVNFSAGYLNFSAYPMSIKREYAQIIDGYFDMYGYKVNRVCTPDKNHRKNYWYTKCIDVNIVGAIPMDDLQAIRNCYNNGITFWKNPANIMIYSVDNEPL